MQSTSLRVGCSAARVVMRRLPINVLVLAGSSSAAVLAADLCVQTRCRLSLPPRCSCTNPQREKYTRRMGKRGFRAVLFCQKEGGFVFGFSFGKHASPVLFFGCGASAAQKTGMSQPHHTDVSWLQQSVLLLVNTWGCYKSTVAVLVRQYGHHEI